MMKLGFIGGGNMAQAIVSSLLTREMEPSQLFVTDPNNACQKYFAELSIQTSASVEPLMQNTDILVMAVKPQILPSVLESMVQYLKSTHVIVSIAAGITISQLRKYLKNATNPIIRVMPNTPALVGLGMSALVSDIELDASTKVAVTAIFEACGKALWVTSEADIDTVTAVSGSGPAYFFLLIESLVNTGKRLGLSDEACRMMVTQTALGAAQMVETSDVGPDILRQRVTSPGGTTEAALRIFQEEDFGNLVERALIAARDRAVALSRDTL